MILIVLYGPPASGKYTIAKLLSKRLGYKFFHNHITLDLLKPFFEFGTRSFFDFSDKIRLDIIEEATKQNLPGMVFTFVYNKSNANNFIEEMTGRVAKHGGQVKFIQLYCDKEELIKRVGAAHRLAGKKLNSPQELLKLLEEKDLQSSIPEVSSYRIDNTHLNVKETLTEVLKII